MTLESESEVTQSYPTLCNPMDCSLPGFSVHGIFQARVLEWGAIAFSQLLLLLLSRFSPVRLRILISFRIDWFEFLAVQGILKSLLQHHSPKA